MTKPTMKRETAVTHVLEPMRQINFYATADAVTEFEEYGRLDKSDHGLRDHYTLIVDGRFDFNEVLSFIRDYGTGD